MSLYQRLTSAGAITKIFLIITIQLEMYLLNRTKGQQSQSCVLSQKAL
jgi:hypothetical protein